MARSRGRPRSIDSYPELMRVADVAEFMGLTTPRIYEMVAQGQIPVQRVGRRILISKAELVKRFSLGDSSPDDSAIDDEVIEAVRELIAQNTQMVAHTARQLEVAERLLARLAARPEKEKAS